MTSDLGPLDQLLGQLLETWEQRYSFEFDRQQRLILFTRGDMQVGAGEVGGGLIRVAYDSAPEVVTEEFCTPKEAAELIEAILFREQLCKVPKPEG